jgi:tRNA pseudouridine55 synthase
MDLLDLNALNLNATDTTRHDAPVSEQVAVRLDQGPRKSKKAQIKIKRRSLHGVLLIDKPLGASSNQVLQRVKWLLKAEKAGHTGTLDPLASGVLPICLGAATKFSQLHLDADKTYLAIARLGQNTSTADAEGQITQTRDASGVDLSAPSLAQVQASFIGPIEQTPPMYSALKVQGKALYDYARDGVELELQPRRVTIHALDMTEFKSLSDLERLTPLAHWKLNEAFAQEVNSVEGTRALAFKVQCSKGTYVRTLAQDIGEHLGVGAHLVYLRRTASGEFGIDQCMDMDALESVSQGSQPQEALREILPTQCLLKGHEPIALDESDSAKFLSGVRRTGPWRDFDRVAVYAQHPTVLLGSAHTKGGELIPDRLLNPLEINSILESLL